MSLKRRAIFAATVLAVAAADQASKAVAAAHLGAEPARMVALGPIRLQLVRNPGAAFGLGPGLTVWITVITLAALVLLARMGWRAGAPAWAAVFGLIAGGALGNGIDRLARGPAPFHGAVVDWIKLPFYGPVFNLADIALRGGMLLALVLLLRTNTNRAAGSADVAGNPAATIEGA
ncbi:MAG: signal peptidase II [Nonomuraea sp.]|nr:signal peptidase II [Nonomuraea sp.]